MTDIRWKQRLENLTKSLVHLEDAVSVSNASLLQKAGTIQFFVMSFELSWKTLKDYLLICHSYYPLLKTLHIKLEELSHE